MAIDTASKRRAAGHVARLAHGVGLTPDAAKPVTWRQQVGRSYSGIAPTPPSAATGRADFGIGQKHGLTDEPFIGGGGSW